MTSNRLLLGAIALVCLSSSANAFSMPSQLGRLHGASPVSACFMDRQTRSTSNLRMQDGEVGDSSRRQFTQGAAAVAAGFLVNGAQPVAAKGKGEFPLLGDEKIMAPKAHGTTEKPVQQKLRWGCDTKLADNICSFNRDFAEFAGYWETTKFLDEAPRDKEITFHDSVTGKPLFVAPRGRSFEDFVKESKVHGWPSFRDQEVVWENVRCLPDGESVSLAGTHLGHNLPDRKGNRYCINLVSVAGMPA